MNIEEEINKLKYQIDILKDTLDSDKYPIESLILNLNLNEDKLNQIYDIFDIFEQKLENNEKDINWTEFEHKLRDTLDIGYQTVKTIIIAFYNNYQWVDVCYHYAKAYQCVEFHSLIADYEKRL